MNPKKCPFMRQNGRLMRAMVDQATDKQKRDLHRLPADSEAVLQAAGNRDSPMFKAWYITQWLKRLGQKPAYWSRSKWRGRIVHPSRVDRELELGRK